ncbi:Uncharacterized protein CLAVI_000136 [Candidatus Clavichlamydia salmonicola]|uniref:SET domain-containing protein-lysine N-methyltransferase n=1 Tax=Candidatus Clavichlamydia salmonicola TaxID=469812 RepID=UPI001E5D4D3E|nr:SET domain-containing protein-lysine N-methyltransferase [Candidatus Clavichlamydia salmonicola]MBF5050526.1 Uncharacterized protein [Candidatus Clavichlamydia salmonicola]
MDTSYINTIKPFSRKSSLVNLSLDKDLSTAKYYSISRLEELLQFSYIPCLVFENWETEKRIKMLCKHAQKKNLILPNDLWLGKLHHKEIILGHIPPISIGWHDSGIGYGVFAKEDLPAWSFLGEYSGILRTQHKLFGLQNDYCFRYPLSRSIFSYFSLDSGHFGSFTRFINHSDHPNAEALSVFCNNIYHVIIRATEPIKKGTEITYNYGPFYWRNREKRF